MTPTVREALAALLAKLPRCTHPDCDRAGTAFDPDDGADWLCSEHDYSQERHDPDWAEDVEAAERALAAGPVEPDTSADDRELSRWFTEYAAQFNSHGQEIAISQLRKAIRRQEAEKDPEQRAVVVNLKREIQIATEGNAAKNKLLDALHLVWCSGGCEGGVHRHTDEKLSEELVAMAEHSVKRLRSKFETLKKRGSSKVQP